MNSRNAVRFQQILAQIKVTRKPEKIALLLAKAAKICPNEPWAHLMLGNTCVGIEEIESAIASFEKGLKLAPDNYKIASNLAALYVQRGCPTKAYEVLKSAENEQQREIDYWFNLGFSAEKCELLDEAARAYEKALSINIKHKAALQGLAGVSITMSNLPRAKECYQQLLDLEPENRIAQYFVDILQGNKPERAPGSYVEKLFDQFVDHYDQDLQVTLRSRCPDAVAKALLLTLSGRNPAKVLDLGCGTGLVGSMLATQVQNLHITGVDLSANMLARAKARGIYEDLIHEDLQSYLNRAEGGWDYILASDTLIYFGDLEGLFEQASRLLVDGGYLIFTIELAQSDAVEVQANGRFRHPRNYLLTKMQSAGFSVQLQALEIRLEKSLPVPGLLVVGRKALADLVNFRTEEAFQNALVLHQSGKLAEARAAYKNCLALNPNHPHALTNLGSVCRKMGKLEEAIAYLQRAVTQMPDDAGINYNLGNALRDAGQLEHAETHYRKAVALDPQSASLAYNLGVFLAGTGRVEEAKAIYRQALAIDPTHWEARLNLGVLLGAEGCVSEATEQLQTLLDHPLWAAAAINNLAGLVKETGQTEQAIALLRRATELQPDLSQPRSNLLMGLQYHPHTTSSELLAHAKDWGAWAMARVGKETVLPPVLPAEAENRPLRVGYLSADLCMHPVGLFLKDVIAAHDASVTAPIIYSNSSPRDGIFTAIVEAAKAKGGGFREVSTLDDPALAVQIRADKIDILVDLAGHSGKSRVAALAWKPAPLQIAWLGYFATTGLPTMDFVILDPFHAPPGTEAQFTEALIRLPHNRFCYTPVPFAPAVSPAPTFSRGFVTFGSFNNTGKLNDTVLDTWAQILAAVPASRLILKWRTFADTPYCERVLQFFAKRGIAADRIELRTMSVHGELLKQYADIDIALDPFPFSGGHTSCEALWMGVPVVTLPQERVVSRQTWSFLNNIGLPGLAAQSVDGYIRLAVGLANSPETLKELRESLRERMRASPLCDVPGYTRLLEAAYRKAWAAAVHRAEAIQVAALAVEPALARAAPEYLSSLRLKNDALRAALNQNPDQPDLWIELAEQMASLFHHEAAVACADEALLRRKDDTEALTIKGNALRAAGKVSDALVCYQKVMDQLPGSAVAHCNLGVAMQNLGRYDEAIAAYERAIARHSGFPMFWSNLAVALTYSPRHTPVDTLDTLRRFDAEITRPLRDARPHANDRNPDRRLKVGYVSPDLRKHAVAYFALPLIEGHHEDHVEVFCYYNHRQNDEWTAAFRQAAHHWRDCAGMSDDELAEQIRADGIDILIDLAGHTENNRLLTFARKPAPVQVTWMGYVTTTGMSAMDWRITHVDADPDGTDIYYSEKLYRLPGTMWCYRPLHDMPAVSPAPIFTKGHITFGSFNRYSKNGAAVLAAWAEILQRVPDSRLIVCVPEGEIRQQMAQFFNERGINPGRIDAFAKLDHEEFWKLHGEVDIALDPFPFGGGTTTCETLWLGLPVVTCTGEGGDFAPRFASRMGKAFLSNIGHPELVVGNIRNYIDTAVALALDRERLKALRQSLRPAMAAAPLTDVKRFVTEMEAAYRHMWQIWCNRPQF